MLDVLSPSIMHPNGFFSDQPLSNKTLRKELLMQKLANLRNRIGACEEQIHVVKEEQRDMEHTAVVIQHDQIDIAREQEKLKERQLCLKENVQQIKQNHMSIQQIEACVSLTINALIYCMLNVYRNHVHVKQELVRIENNRQKIKQDAAKIHQNISVITHHFQQAWKKVKVIEAKATHIQESHQMIAKAVTEIEQKRTYIRANIPRLIPIQRHYEDLDEHDQTMQTKKITHEEAIGWLKKIQDFGLWLITTLCQKITQAIQYLQSWLVGTNFSVDHPTVSSLISCVAMGAFAITGMVEIHFSLDSWILKGVLIDLKTKD